MTEALEKARSDWPYLRKRRGPSPSFHEYWRGGAAESFAGYLAERIGMLDACRRRGVQGLLEVKCVWVYVGANLSLVYAQMFEGRQPDARRAEGDAWDLRHALSASAADIFVAHDKAFADRMKRVPINDFEVMNFHELSMRLREGWRRQWTLRQHSVLRQQGQHPLSGLNPLIKQSGTLTSR